MHTQKTRSPCGHFTLLGFLLPLPILKPFYSPLHHTMWKNITVKGRCVLSISKYTTPYTKENTPKKPKHTKLYHFLQIHHSSHANTTCHWTIRLLLSEVFKLKNKLQRLPILSTDRPQLDQRKSRDILYSILAAHSSRHSRGLRFELRWLVGGWAKLNT